MAGHPRPLSPHLQIYRRQLTSVTSILHRLTGIGLAVGLLYLVSALVLGGAFVALAIRLRRATTPANARRLFTYSLAYLALLFVAMALDPILL